MQNYQTFIKLAVQNYQTEGIATPSQPYDVFFEGIAKQTPITFGFF